MCDQIRPIYHTLLITRVEYLDNVTISQSQGLVPRTWTLWSQSPAAESGPTMVKSWGGVETLLVASVRMTHEILQTVIYGSW